MSQQRGKEDMTMKKQFLVIILTTLLSACSNSKVEVKGLSFRSLSISSIEKTTIRQTYKDYDSSSLVSSGNIKIAVIPIWFLDSPKYLNPVEKYKMRENIDLAFFGDPEDIGWHSVKSYYEEESQGAFHLSGLTSYWYEYEGFSSDFYLQQNETALKNMTEWFFANNPSENRLDYDADGNGYLDMVSFIYAAPDSITAQREYDDRDHDNMWAYKSNIHSPIRNYDSPNLNTYFWASYDFLKGYRRADVSHSKIDTTTFIHEFGHCFGILDYYDYNNSKSPAGGFSMQDYNVGGHDPYSVMSIGWANPYIPTESMTIELGAFQKNHDLILLTPEWNGYDSPFDEYMLLELYTPTGLNEFHDQYGLMGERHYTGASNNIGVRLWHVDATLTYLDGLIRYFTSDAKHYNTGHAYSNTYYVEGGYNNDRISQCGQACSDYNLLECIQANQWYEYNPTDIFYTQYLYTPGTAFSLRADKAGTSRYDSDYQRLISYIDKSNQFVKQTKLNNNKELGWAFEVLSIEGEGDDAVATIKLIKE